ncbi:hypothetical protein ABKN59_011760 [Abortiporus biennis]
MTAAEVAEAHSHLVAFCDEFETLYVQQCADRIHLTRQCIHVLGHLGPETYRLGPAHNHTEATMEHTIGNLGEEIRQPSNPYANLSECSLYRGQVNAFFAMYPQFAPPSQGDLPQGSLDLGGGICSSSKS